MIVDLNELIEVCREELDCLWDDLNDAVRDAINGEWSINCGGLEERIKALTKLVGPTSWESVHIPLLESGVYQRIHAEIGIDAPVDMDGVRRTRASINERRRATS